MKTFGFIFWCSFIKKSVVSRFIQEVAGRESKIRQMKRSYIQVSKNWFAFLGFVSLAEQRTFVSTTTTRTTWSPFTAPRPSQTGHHVIRRIFTSGPGLEGNTAFTRKDENVLMVWHYSNILLDQSAMGSIIYPSASHRSIIIEVTVSVWLCDLSISKQRKLKIQN